MIATPVLFLAGQRRTHPSPRRGRACGSVDRGSSPLRYRLPLVALLLLAGSPALAAPRRDPSVLHLAPAERVEQRCNARAMDTIGREHKAMRPDELVAYAFSDTEIDDDSIAAPGAAVRSAGRWYHLSYHCRTAADGLDVVEFDYALGDEVPRRDWQEHYLVP